MCVLRRPGFLFACSAVLAVGACRPARPWQAVDWRPATPPQRIVAASVFATEVLLAIAPRERIAAVHVLAADARYSLVTAAAQGLPLAGADPEQLLAARPDLVVCDAFTRPETLALLAAADVPVVMTADPATFDDVAANIARVGRWCHLEDAAARVVQDMTARLRQLARRAPEVASWRVMSLDGALHSYGRPSLFDAVVAAAGAQNLAAARGVGPFRKLDLETVLSWRADALVLGASGDEPGSAVPAWLRQTPGLPLLPAVQRQRLVRIHGPLLGTTSHHLVAAAEALQQQLLQWGRP